MDLGILGPEEGDRYSPGDVRRAMMVKSLEDGGISLDAVAAAIGRGALSFDFVDALAYERFAALAPKTAVTPLPVQVDAAFGVANLTWRRT